MKPGKWLSGQTSSPLYIRLLELEPTAGLRLEPTPGANAGGDQEAVSAFLLNRHGENGFLRAQSLDQPVPTVTCRGAGYLTMPGAQPFHNSNRQNNAPRSPDQPIHSVTTLTGGGEYLVSPEAKPFVGANRTDNAPRSIDQPIPPATTAHGGGSFLVEPGIRPFLLGQQSQAAPRPADDPAPTVAGAGAISLVRPIIIEYYGESHAGAIDQPLSTITANRKHGFVKPTLVEYYSQSHGADVDEPLPTVTTRARHGLANPVLVEINHGNGRQGCGGNDRRVHSIDEPLAALTTIPGIGLAQPVLFRTGQTGENGNYTRTTDQPAPTLTTQNDVCLAAPTAEPYPAQNAEDPSGSGPATQPATDRPLAESILEQALEAGIEPRRLVFVDGQPYLLDIRFRMLQNGELARAMGFEDHETSYEFTGNVSQVTKQIGNAVPVHLAAALVRAVLEPSAEEPETAQPPAGTGHGQ